MFKTLIVDDAGLIRDLIRKALRDHFPNWQISEEINGSKARQTIKNQVFDLILCDWEMPEMSGEELLTWYRQEHKGKTPFIMVTSRGDKEHVVKAIQAGVSNYLVKPFNNQQLIEKVSVTLKKAGVDVEHEKRQRLNPSLANNSLDALMGKPDKKKPSRQMSHAAGSLDALTMHNQPQKKATSKKRNPAAGACQLRFGSGLELRCATKNVTLQKIIAIAKTSSGIPQLLEQAVIDIEVSADNSVARINGFVQAIEAVEKSMTSEAMQMTIQIVDNDADKIEQLSKYIAQVKK